MGRIHDMVPAPVGDNFSGYIFTREPVKRLLALVSALWGADG